MESYTASRGVSRFALWFGLLGGGAAWTVHLIASSIIAEWGGFAGVDDYTWQGISLIAWATLAVSAAMTLIAAAATLVAFLARRRLRREHSTSLESQRTTVFMANAGWIASAVFLLIILAQTVPIFFFLRDA